MNLPLIIARIFLCCSAFLLINCNAENGFERDISFNSGWERNSSLSGSATTFSKDFKMDVQQDKLYLLQISSPQNIARMQLNKTSISSSPDSNKFEYNLTNLLQEQNTLVFTIYNTIGVSDLNATLQKVNRLFISQINIEIDKDKSTEIEPQVEVKIRNAHSVEKQGSLKYSVYSSKQELLKIYETPVFISGNAENIYLLKIDLSEIKREENIRVECELFANGKLVDKYFRECLVNTI